MAVGYVNYTAKEDMLEERLWCDKETKARRLDPRRRVSDTTTVTELSRSGSEAAQCCTCGSEYRSEGCGWDTRSRDVAETICTRAGMQCLRQSWGELMGFLLGRGSRSVGEAFQELFGEATAAANGLASSVPHASQQLQKKLYTERRMDRACNHLSQHPWIRPASNRDGRRGVRSRPCQAQMRQGHAGLKLCPRLKFGSTSPHLLLFLAGIYTGPAIVECLLHLYKTSRRSLTRTRLGVECSTVSLRLSHQEKIDLTLLPDRRDSKKQKLGSSSNEDMQGQDGLLGGI